jgi:hypothetical protein
MRKLVLLVAGLVLTAVACGGDEPSEETTTTSRRTTATTRAAPVVESEPTTTAIPFEDEVVEISPTTLPEDEESVTTTGGAMEEETVLTIDAVVTLRALGPVRIGMTVDEASAAAGAPLRKDFGRQSTGSCQYVTAGEALRGVAFMVVDGLIARIEVDRPSPVGTRSGVRIGTSASDLRKVYPDNIQRANDAVAGGEAMAFVPNDDFDANYRIYFEIVDGAVARYRLGIKPAVDFLNGCAEE